VRFLKENPIKSSVLEEIKILVEHYCKYIILLCILIFGSCETIEDTGDFPFESSKLVVNCLFNPDSVWYFEVSKSLSELDNSELSYIDDAIIKIYNETDLIATLDSPSYKLINSEEVIYYSSALKPEIGEQYFMEVSANGFATVTSEGKVPDVVPFEISNFIIIDSLINEFPLGVFWLDLKAKTNIRINDPLFENNYYAFYVLYFNNSGGSVIPYALTTSSDDPSVVGTDDLNLKSVLFNDRLFNGETYELAFNIDCTELPLGNSDKLFFYLVSYTEDTYLYKHSYTLFQETYSDYFSQPVQVYNNIKEGYGIFGGYVIERDSLEFF
jgi:hypothetical protein